MVIQSLTAAAIVTGVGACIIDELSEVPESHGVPKRIVYLTPGEIAWDGCDCGQLALSIPRDYPSVTFPIDSSQLVVLGGCMARPIAYEATASITWCIPGLDKSGNPPKPNLLLESALAFEGDAFALRSAVECCLAGFKTSWRITDWRAGELRRVGPEGNCAGVEITFYFQLV